MNQFAPLQPQGIEGFTVEPTSEDWDMALKISHQKAALTHRANNWKHLRRGTDRLRAK
jgi:hypothetical protein